MELWVMLNMIQFNVKETKLKTYKYFEMSLCYE